MRWSLLRTAVGSFALIAATVLGVATGSLLAAFAGLGAASVVVFRGPFLVQDRRGLLTPFNATDPWQLSNLFRGFALFVESMLALAVLSVLALLITLHH